MLFLKGRIIHGLGKAWDQQLLDFVIPATLQNISILAAFWSD